MKAPTIRKSTESAAPAPDGLDRWAAERDLRDDNSISSKYVSPDVPGASDLDDNGTWNEEPEYGNVWYPSQVAPGWAPYSYGAWNYVGPWGWTWVGYEPWGFAPYHYGRWAFIGSRWGWCPGPIYARPFYGPAFVGWLGGPRFGVGFGFGAGFGVGWFPLGFHEPYYPGFHASRGYINNINVHNTVIRNTTVLNSRNFNNYAYAHNTRAVTAASRTQFVGGQSINRGANHITEASLRGAQVMNRNSFTPTRASSFGAAHMNARATPPATVQNRSVMARTAPAPPLRISRSSAMTGNFTAARPNNNVANRAQYTVAAKRLQQFATESNFAKPSANDQQSRGKQSRFHQRPHLGSARQLFRSRQRAARLRQQQSQQRRRQRRNAHSHRPSALGRLEQSVERRQSRQHLNGRQSQRLRKPRRRNLNEPQLRNLYRSRQRIAPAAARTPRRARNYPSSRSNSEPSRSYSPPARTSAPAPSRSSGGGSAPHSSMAAERSHGGGGGSGSHGGGGSPHGGGHH